MKCNICDTVHEQNMKYCIWFPDFIKFNKFFNNKKEVIKYARSKKVEAYLNIYPCTDQEDTILGINVPDHYGEIIQIWKKRRIKTMKRVITFNIWNFIDINDINNIIDDDLLDDKIEGVASDIKYDISKIDKDGNITVNCDFELDKL